MWLVEVIVSIQPLLDEDCHRVIDIVRELAATPERWSEGRQVFDALRRRSREFEANASDLSHVIFRLAEECTKVISNWSGVLPSFDVTAPIRVVESVRTLLGLLKVKPGSDDWQRVEDAVMRAPHA